jgi:hypothetical protein
LKKWQNARVGGIPDICVRKQKIGIVISAVVILLSNPVTLMKPGPKNKGICPSELHIRLPEDCRLFIESFGPGSVNDRIVNALRELSNQRCPSTIPALKSRLKSLTRDARELQQPMRECNLKLEELIPDEIEQNKFWDEINSELAQERKD